MSQAAAVLTNLVAATFVLVGLVSVVQWLRNRDPALGYLALSVGLLGVVAAIGRVQPALPQGRAVFVAVSVCAFLGSGYALLLFRSRLAPLPRPAELIATVVVVLSALVAVIWLTFIPASATPSIVTGLITFELILVWSVLVGEPIVTFCRASRGRPRVQKARLRTLSAGFGGIAGIVLIATLGGSALRNPWAILATQLAALATAPLIYASFSPPAWLRAWWRAPEEDGLRRGLQDLILFSPGRPELARRAVEWAARLLGADAALILDEEGKLLAAGGPKPDEAEALIASSMEAGDAKVGSPVHGSPRSLSIPLHLRGGQGRLLVVAGSVHTDFRQRRAG